MPNRHETLSSLFDDIADAIRSKTGSTDELKADDFDTAIDAIPSGGGGSTDYFWIENIDDSTATFFYYQNGNVNIDLQYSRDKTNWYNVVNNVTTIPAGEKIYLKNNTNFLNVGSTNYIAIQPKISNRLALINIGGRINSLINDIDGRNCHTYAFTSLFHSSGVVDASQLILCDTTSSYCYYTMFGGCHSLTTPPALPATYAASNCYNSMFIDCPLLTTPPALPATRVDSNAYSSMFNGCTSLKVFSASSGGHTVPWRIPSSGTFVTDNTHQNMFTDVYTDNVPSTFRATYDSSSTYYTEFDPID